MSERKTFFADVIVPLSVNNLFTYRVPFELNDAIQVGVRVVVPFGRSKFYTGIVSSVHEQIPENYQAKYIETILDDTPIVTDYQIRLWKWMADYYMSSIGDVMNAALPSNFKLASETRIVLHPDFELTNEIENLHFQTIIDALEVKEELDLKEISDLLAIKTVQPIIKKMIDQRIVISVEELNYKYVDKTASFIFLEDNYQNIEELALLLDQLDKNKAKQKQVEALTLFLSLSDHSFLSMPVLKKDLEEKGVSTSTINTLSKNGIFKIEKLKIDRFKTKNDDFTKELTLSPAQSTAFQEIKEAFTQNKTTLLHGITGSGKTEIYIQLIKEAIANGQQVLFLLPEIALTTQLIQRLEAYFGDLVGVYHSKFNQNERVDIWNHVLNNHPKRFRIILGARSSLFLPFRNLGLIIVDEEHEASYKQMNPSPRYNARDMAIILSGLFKSNCLLGSATPSMETYFNATSDKFALVELNERYGDATLPEILCVDIKAERKNGTMQSHFTSVLISQIKLALENKSQVILFQNRRGYTPSWTCELCNWTPKCVNCDVSLTYHKFSNHLKCHHCGYTSAPIGSCKNCGSNRLNMLGFGTEKIEDELSVFLPNAVIKRMDLDSTRSKNAYQSLIEDFENKKIDILVGTQMLSKGLDFENVSLVGILDADQMLNRPDFRAFERSYQLMSQVAGRAGRKNKKGTVIIQTGKPDHWIIQKVIANDYIGFYETEIIERKNFMYPPFFKLITISLKEKDDKKLVEGAAVLGNELKQVFGNRILGPEFPIIKRVNNFYINVITVKIEREFSPKKVKDKINEIIEQFYTQVSFKSIRISIDVDPV
jgi:primosomal protein N' (replication factor Y)